MNSFVAIAFVVLAVATVISADGGYHKHNDYHAPAYYQYGYKVNGDYHKTNFGHNEQRDGKYTKGTYYVHLPDGRVQTVNYHVDGYNGYVADVSYSGYAKPHNPHPAPYHPPKHHGGYH